MKKLLIAATIVSSLASLPAMAATKGNYLGIDLLATNFKLPDGTITPDGKFGTQSRVYPGIGVDYKYAVNSNSKGFFLAHDFFFDYNHVVIENDYRKLSVDYSAGLKWQLGYDITDKFAIFGSFGGQIAHFKAEEKVDGQNVLTGNDEKGADTDSFYIPSLVYGGGLKYSVMQNVDLSLTYDYVDVPMFTAYHLREFNPQVYKLGLAYNF